MKRVKPACTRHFQRMSRLYTPALEASSDRIVVSTLSCGLSNPGPNPDQRTAMSFRKGCILNEIKLTV